MTTTIFIVLSSTAVAICESSLWFLWAKVGQRQVAANSGQAANLTFESACRLL